MRLIDWILMRFSIDLIRKRDNQNSKKVDVLHLNSNENEVFFLFLCI